MQIAKKEERHRMGRMDRALKEQITVDRLFESLRSIPFSDARQNVSKSEFAALLSGRKQFAVTKGPKSSFYLPNGRLRPKGIRIYYQFSESDPKAYEAFKEQLFRRFRDVLHIKFERYGAVPGMKAGSISMTEIKKTKKEEAR